MRPSVISAICTMDDRNKLSSGFQLLREELPDSALYNDSTDVIALTGRQRRALKNRPQSH